MQIRVCRYADIVFYGWRGWMNGWIDVSLRGCTRRYDGSRDEPYGMTEEEFYVV